MQVKIFSQIIRPSTSDADAFELEINNWLAENDDIEILSITISSSERDSDISMVFFVAYDELEDDGDGDGDELTVTLPRITVKDLSPLIPRLR